ncbi:hypothetical protein L1987_21225 [Smallanthus sonchifolius]|uniref:Uncharacterized protein n=1 Tax=Smallanthus sonchifolius TaxID=185202 RepID=A0ACB9IVN9_9ASTR|nr:hypothetical protein L1987_21225 [Smallanthus sonchifolius]
MQRKPNMEQSKVVQTSFHEHMFLLLKIGKNETLHTLERKRATCTMQNTKEENINENNVPHEDGDRGKQVEVEESVHDNYGADQL